MSYRSWFLWIQSCINHALIYIQIFNSASNLAGFFAMDISPDGSSDPACFCGNPRLGTSLRLNRSRLTSSALTTHPYDSELAQPQHLTLLQLPQIQIFLRWLGWITSVWQPVWARKERFAVAYQSTRIGVGAAFVVLAFCLMESLVPLAHHVIEIASNTSLVTC